MAKLSKKQKSDHANTVLEKAISYDTADNASKAQQRGNARPTAYTKETGYGSTLTTADVRLMNPDGSSNVVQRGLPWFRPNDAYHTLIRMHWAKFWGLLMGSYLALNALFAFVYYFVGVHNLKGANSTDELGAYWDAFFFSAQTLTTVGYGGMAPVGMMTNWLVVLHLVVGWTFFAIVTGVLYGRFSRPHAKLIYAKEAVVAPYKDGVAFMFRLANARNTTLIDVDVEIIYTQLEPLPNGDMARRFYNMELEVRHINFLTLSWTLVHPITPNSPLWGLSDVELSKRAAEVLVLVRAFDDTFSQTVHSRKSYRHEEITWGVKYRKIFASGDHGITELYLDKIHDYDQVVLPDWPTLEEEEPQTQLSAEPQTPAANERVTVELLNQASNASGRIAPSVAKPFLY